LEKKWWNPSAKEHTTEADLLAILHLQINKANEMNSQHMYFSHARYISKILTKMQA
jgi:hypothetical protein